MADVAAVFDADPVAEPHAPDFNVTPRRSIYVVVEDGTPEGPAPARHLALMRWGLIPSWAKDPSIGDRLINARAETLAEKPSFRAAYKRRRCIVPADGFYEWQARAGSKTKQPMYIHRADDAQLAFAGLWEAWRDPAAPDAPPLETCTIITTDANDAIRPIHERMPVILERDTWDLWLEPDVEARDALDPLLVPAADDVLTWHPVGRAVNSPRNNGPELVEPIEPESLF